MFESLAPFVFALGVFIGIFLTFVPILPAIFYMLVISVLFGFVDNFIHLTSTELLILVGIYLVSFCVDLFSGVLGAKYGGASLKSILWGFLGIFIGTLALPPFGGIAGLFLGVLLSEWQSHRNSLQALKTAAFSFFGVLTGVAINVLLGLVFFTSFVVLVFFH